ncbi:PhzF family phenazine biosynthesis protein [Yokenella regensburgei]|uniref:PhzF family phenazine biosynthesis protein n=1 Tax=Yokenella regensburgei TaxID=158877 RepID=UPI003F1456B4
MELAIYQVDAFSNGPFSGNPAAVCITPDALEAATMQNIAAEMAVSETAFLTLRTRQLRWFTPLAEVDLCGHATLATAHVLRQTGQLQVGERIEFTTLSGPLTAIAHASTIELDFPLTPPDMRHLPDARKVAALGLEEKEIVACGRYGAKEMIVIEDAQRIENLAPDFQALAALPGRGVAVTAPGRENQDFISRYFAPWVGVNEDPVTGSAHCALAAYWSARSGKRSLRAWQASARGGEVVIELAGSDRVRLFGAAHTVLAGKLFI